MSVETRTPAEQPREFAAIDLGSNSFHMIVARIVNGSIQVLSRLKRRVRLADGLDENRILNQEAMDRGLACLSLFADRLQGFSAENVKVVGTYTLRRALNNDEFLKQAQAIFPFPIQIISGQDEARLIYSGVSHTQPEKGRKLVVDIGGGKNEVGIISLSGVVYSQSVRVGVDAFDEAIVNYVRRNYGMLVGESTAEEIKKQIGSAFPGMEVTEMEVKGRNLAEGVPRSFTITSNEVLEALADPISQIVQSVRNTLEQTPPELGADIAERGLVLTGGGALLKGFDRLLAEETGLPVTIADDPLTCVARGSGMALDLIGKLNSIFINNP